MIARILHVLTTVVVYSCLATVIAAGILAAYYSRAWHLDRTKFVQMLAIAQGADLEAVVDAARGPRPSASTEQPSYQEILEARAVKARNLELREHALRSSLQQLDTEQRRLGDQRKQFDQLRESFQGELLAMEKGAAAAGRDEARRTLETLKPKQAKELIGRMLQAKELDEVVLLLASMTEAKRGKIIAEFKTPEEVEQVSEVLRRLRQGLPTSSMAENTQRQLETSKGPRP